MKVTDININTKDGRLLMAAVLILKAESRTLQEPNKIMLDLEEMAAKLYTHEEIVAEAELKTEWKFADELERVFMSYRVKLKDSAGYSAMMGVIFSALALYKESLPGYRKAGISSPYPTINPTPLAGKLVKEAEQEMKTLDEKGFVFKGDDDKIYLCCMRGPAPWFCYWAYQGFATLKEVGHMDVLEAFKRVIPYTPESKYHKSVGITK